MFPVYSATRPAAPACVAGGGKNEPVGRPPGWLETCGGRDAAEAGLGGCRLSHRKQSNSKKDKWSNFFTRRCAM